LPGLAIRPRKWRIATRTQAADCFRRLAEQDRSMWDFDAGKEHLSRAYSIIDDSLAKDDFDSRMLDLYSKILEDALFAAIHDRDEVYAGMQLERLNRLVSRGTKPAMRALSLDGIQKCFGTTSPVFAKASKMASDVIWASPRDDAREKRGTVRLSGTVKHVPSGVSYGFVTDESGEDWFMHRTSLRNPQGWAGVSTGVKVTFIGVRDRHGRGRTDDVEMETL
jgi:cold shock CspA family protein